MRKSFLLISAAVLISACADDQHSTAPTSRPSASGRSAASDVGNSAPAPQAKPNSQAGFTTVSSVTSSQGVNDNYSFTATTVVASCPAGSTLTGGGSQISGNAAARVDYSGPDGANGWKVVIENPAYTTIYFHAFALCAS